MIGLLAVATTLSFNGAPAGAANYGGFGSTYSEVIAPKDAVVNDETFKSDDVKAGLDGLNNILSTVKSIRADLVTSYDLSSCRPSLSLMLTTPLPPLPPQAQNGQIDIYSGLKSKLNTGSIRNTLNKVRIVAPQ